jgi:hypothetical protein
MISDPTDRMTFPIWASFSYRTILSVSPDYSNGRVESRRRCGKSFVPSNSNQFEGIIPQRTEICGRNLRDSNNVTILTTAE